MLRGIWAFAVLVASTLGLGLAAIALTLISPRRYWTTRLGRLWSRIMLRVIKVDPEYFGEEHARTAGPCVFIANHQSNADIWAVVPRLPDPTLFVAKRSLFSIPVMGSAMRLGGFVSIDRANLGSAIRSLSSAVEQVRNGRSVILFPEGTRSRDGRLGPFKKGAFHLALQARVPVVPIAISGTWGVIRPRRLTVRPGPVRVTFCEPVEVTPYLPDDVPGLSREVRSAIARHLDPMELDAGDAELELETR